MRVLELFAGSRSIGKAAESLGHEVVSVDIEPFDGIDIVTDLEFATVEQLGFNWDMIWASPPCTTYSIAGISHHRDGVNPKSDFAKKSDRIMERVLLLIELYYITDPNLKWYIENPRGMMRKMPFMQGLPRATIWYCQYGSDERAKPTDIWSNNIRCVFNPDGWQPRPECFNGNTHCHHQPAPRGSKTGTQGRKGNYERSKIPHELCLEIIKSSEK